MDSITESDNTIHPKQNLTELITSLEKFSGNLEEFNKYKNTTYEIIPLSRSYLFLDLSCNKETIQKTLEQGCTALIYYVPPVIRKHFQTVGDYGIPVRLIPTSSISSKS